MPSRIKITGLFGVEIEVVVVVGVWVEGLDSVSRTSATASARPATSRY